MINLPKIKPKKELGQHFLTNDKIIDKIIKASSSEDTSCIIEIGPGTGALTQHLIHQSKELILIEKDRTLSNHLEENLKATHHPTIINDDFMNVDLSHFPQSSLIIGNLPYNMATPIILKFIKHKDHFRKMLCMVQLDHAKRIAAKEGGKDYGSLSCFLQYHANIKVLFKIRPSAFNPPPKVDSAFLEIEIHETPPYPSLNEDYLFKFIQQGFSQRRKKLINACQGLIDKVQLEKFMRKEGIRINKRAEEISLEDFVKLTNLINQETSKEGQCHQPSNQ